MIPLSQLTARLLIWLAAMAVSVQGTPAISCGCASDGESCCSGVESQPCCCSNQIPTETASNCCSKTTSKMSSCCSSNGPTREGCGTSCHCGTDSGNIPATPPVSSNESSSTNLICLPIDWEMASLTASQAKQDVFFAALSAALDAAERCAVLCRFTL